MKLKRIAKVESGQDIAIWGEYLFDFVAHGKCLGEVSVYKLSQIHEANGEEPEPICRFILDKAEKIVPHANAVCFGTEYYEDGDEFPLIYANVYNTYSKCENRLEGVCLVYRLMRDGNAFSSELVQAIEIGFVEDREMWKSTDGNGDVRPYGNFIIDRENVVLYAFVMRDKPNNTRYFKFEIPAARDGVFDERFGVIRKTLELSDVKEYFDTEYHKGIQGACVHNGLIYSLEGGAVSNQNPAAFRIIDPKNKRLLLYCCFSRLGSDIEPEGIDFSDGVCYYVGGYGDTFILEI